MSGETPQEPNGAALTAEADERIRVEYEQTIAELRRQFPLLVPGESAPTDLLEIAARMLLDADEIAKRGDEGEP